MRRRAAILACLLSAAAGAQLQVSIASVPDDLVLPLPAGRNLLLTATVAGGEAADVWLARSPDSEARVPLQPAGEGRFQLNLADPAVAALVRAAGEATSLAVFARGRDGPTAASVRLRYALAPDARRLHVLVHEASRVRKLEGGGTAWVSPREVARIDLALPVARPLTDSIARLGGRILPLDRGEQGGARLEVTAAIAAEWAHLGELEIRSRTDPDAPAFRLLARPEALVPEGGGAPFEVGQRTTDVVPGTRDYLRVTLGDISGGRVRVRLATAEGADLIAGQLARAREPLPFTYAGVRYALVVDALTNSLFGEDHAKLSIRRSLSADEELIERLLQAIEASPLTFVRNGEPHGGAAAARLLRGKYAAARDRIATVEQFIAEAGTRSSTTGEAYRVRIAGGSEVELAEWLRGQVTALRAEPAGRK